MDSLSLLEEAWLPVRRHDGTRDWISPLQLSDPGIAAFDAPRADFNGALAQFAIGLLQVSTDVDRPARWQQLFNSPPDTATLRQWFEPHATAFRLDGEGARFLQDFTLRAADGEALGIGNLLIETPGENTVKNNADHFIKRGHVRALCPHCAAQALLTLQLNAPAGGVGHRTGLRGGGPLTTLLVTQSTSAHPRSLWHNLWLNVRDRPAFLATNCDEARTDARFSFPWLADVAALQKADGATAPAQVHPAHVYWSMPRRIRLDFDNVIAGECDLCGRHSERLVQHYVTRNYGLNYKGAWNHPLSPYYESKEGWLPLHPQPGGIGYRHWLGWVLGYSTDKKHLRPATMVEYALARLTRKLPDRLRLWAFGFDMDNAKARCWYEATLPLYGLPEQDEGTYKELEGEIGYWLAGAELAASYMRNAVKDAWFSADARGDFSHLDASFWSRTEPAFYSQLRQRLDVARANAEGGRVDRAQHWHGVIQGAALSLFDTVIVGAGPVERQKPERIAQARRQLCMNLAGPKLKAALGLPTDPKPARKSAKKTAEKA
ncbi:type I-E CRISPR-associated protein Cse1/CasA [Azohydromonas lata]|uniref:type I-E CRISPR-associated protein Cse1/CasA n=1 Tax=Azohydromonas lata TaxID=45677 RepID=UPI000A008B7E|nr:type I-E CRISPR-associated protein Cse1/CasA [Azohydromonas lata]